MRLPRSVEIGGAFFVSFLGTFHVVILVLGPQGDPFSTPGGGYDQTQALLLFRAKQTNANTNTDANAHKGDGLLEPSLAREVATPADASSSLTASQIKTALHPQGTAPPSPPRFHTAMTCDSSGYSKWQSRVMYFWYKHFKEQEGSGMGGFSRVLHTGKPDELMEEIPTFIVDPLPDSITKGYVVLNRPYAFEQWILKAPIEEEYIWMAEPDHLIVRPIPNLAEGDKPSAFPFFYIDPKKFEAVLRKWFTDTSRPITDIDPIGNSPVIIKKEQLRRIAPLWKNISMEMKDDKEADKAFGWVQEMYAYATAAALCNVKHLLHKNWMIQPPWDKSSKSTYVIHYTYGQDFNLDGQFTPGKVGPWHFDKRDYNTAPPRNLSLPPKGTPESVVTLITMINEATAGIPNWKAGTP